MSVSTAERNILRNFADEFPFCWACGSPHMATFTTGNTPLLTYPRSLEIHHILGGSARRPHDPRNLSRLCKLCHDLAGGATIRLLGHPPGVTKPLPNLRLDHVLWLKHKADPEHYDRKFLNGLRSRALPPMRSTPTWFTEQRTRFGHCGW